MCKVFIILHTKMKKLFWVLSLSVLLFSTFVPSFTYANNEYNEMAIQLLQQELESLSQTTEWNITQWNNGNDSINLLWQWDNQKTIQYNPNWWFFPWMEKDEILEVKYSYNWETIYINNIQIPNRTVTNWDNCKWWMFAWWFTHSWVNNDRWNEWLWIIDENTESQTVYAKWLKFNDLSFNFSWNNIKIMDRNLWAEQTANWNWNYWYWPFDDERSLWFYFKRWNNHWFREDSPLIINEDIDVSGYWILTWYYSSTYQEKPDNKDLWWYSSRSDFDKQWPCPLWYHIPAKTEWEKFNKLFYENTDCSSYQDKMTCYWKVLKLPYSTYLRTNNDWTYEDNFDFAEHKTPYIANYDMYTSDSMYPYYIPINELWWFRKENTWPTTTTTFNDYLYPIRCFENTEPTRTVTIDYSDWNVIEYWLHWREEKIPSSIIWGIEKDWYRFNWRYNTDNLEKISTSTIINTDISIKAMWECLGWYYESSDWYSCLPYTWTISANWWIWDDITFQIRTPSNTYKNKWYKFVWWNTSENWDWEDYNVWKIIESQWIKLYAKWEKNPRYHFYSNIESQGTNEDILKYEDIIVVSHTDNINDEWETVWWYYNNKTYDKTEILSITWAIALNIKVKYYWNKINSSPDADYFLIWTWSHADYSNTLNSWEAIKMYSWWDNYNYETFTITWNSITIWFKSFENTNWPGYWYHIIVEWYWYYKNDINLNPIRQWHEFLWWYEENSKTPFDFENTPITEDRKLYAKWKSLEEKAEETTVENVVYTNTTTVTVGDEQTEETLSWSSTLTLVSKEVKSNEVTKEEDTTKVQDSEIKVTSDKSVEYEWWLEVYLERTEKIWTQVTTWKIEWTIKFSAPVAVKIPINSEAEYVKVQVKHWDEDFGFKWLTLNPVNGCDNWEALNDKYNWEDIEVKKNNWEKYATIYTCSASTFVAYTENTKPVNNTTSVSSPAAWGWRTIKQESKTEEQEHNSADTEETTKQNNNKSTTTQTRNTPTIKENVKKIEWKTLTRWEIAVMTNILLDVYPQLTEKRTLNEVSEACENFADEQNFTKDEKKAITRLCKLSIMWIHRDNNEPLDEFMVRQYTTNWEFATVMDRVVTNYNEKDLSVVKDALKKLEWDEENVVFGTVYDVFMSIKSIFN